MHDLQHCVDNLLPPTIVLSQLYYLAYSGQLEYLSTQLLLEDLVVVPELLPELLPVVLPPEDPTDLGALEDLLDLSAPFPHALQQSSFKDLTPAEVLNLFEQLYCSTRFLH